MNPLLEQALAQLSLIDIEKQSIAMVRLRELFNDQELDLVEIQDVLLDNPEVISCTIAAETLMVKVCNRGAQAIELLLNLMPELIDKIYPSGMTSLHHAANSGNVPLTEFLLKIRPEMATVKDGNMHTPLHVAAFRGEFEVVDLLLHYNPALINAVDGYGNSALYEASFYITLHQASPYYNALYQAPPSYSSHTSLIKMLQEKVSIEQAVKDLADSSYYLNSFKQLIIKHIKSLTDMPNKLAKIVEQYIGKKSDITFTSILQIPEEETEAATVVMHVQSSVQEIENRMTASVVGEVSFPNYNEED